MVPRVTRLALPSFAVTEHSSPRLPIPAAVRLPNPLSRNAAGFPPSNSSLSPPLPPARRHPGTSAPPCRLANTKPSPPLSPLPCHPSPPHTLPHVNGPSCHSPLPKAIRPCPPHHSPLLRLPLAVPARPRHATSAAPGTMPWRTLSFDAWRTGLPRADPPSLSPPATLRGQSLYNPLHRAYSFPLQPPPRPCRHRSHLRHRRLPHSRHHRRTAPLHPCNPRLQPSHHWTPVVRPMDLTSPRRMTSCDFSTGLIRPGTLPRSSALRRRHRLPRPRHLLRRPRPRRHS